MVGRMFRRDPGTVAKILTLSVAGDCTWMSSLGEEDSTRLGQAFEARAGQGLRGELMLAMRCGWLIIGRASEDVFFVGQPTAAQSKESKAKQSEAKGTERAVKM